MQKVSFIGSGNVATHLATKLFTAGVHIHQIASLTSATADDLAQKVGANGITDLEKLELDQIDFLIVAVRDDVLPEMAHKINKASCIIAHTSGTSPMNTFENHENYGVFYPLQTFSKHKSIDIKSTPFCIEGNKEDVVKSLKSLAELIADNVQFVDTETRKSIHIAAVFACNFSNHMLAIAEDILNDKHVSLSILQPLVEETIQKAFSGKPKEMQTGPAARNDQKVITDHLAKLSSHTLHQTIYKNISQSIISTKNE